MQAALNEDMTPAAWPVMGRAEIGRRLQGAAPPVTDPCHATP